MTQPKVSIIVPIYGVEKYIHECVDSILAQTLKEIEIILVDDGSKDNCPAIVDEYAKKDSRIIAIHQENGGYGKAVNHGLKVATGEYIGIVESDDFIEHNMYEELLKLAKHNDADIVKSAYWEIYDKGNPPIKRYAYWAHRIELNGNNFKIKDYPLFFKYHPSIWSCIYKKSFIVDNSLTFVEAKGGGWVDNTWQVQTFCKANKINWTPHAYYNYRPESVGNSSTLVDANIPVDRFYEIHDFLDNYPDLYSQIFVPLTKKEISYLYTSFLIAFKYSKSLKEIRVFEKKLKKLVSRIPPLTDDFSDLEKKYLKKMKYKNYSLRFLRKKRSV